MKGYGYLYEGPGTRASTFVTVSVSAAVAISTGWAATEFPDLLVLPCLIVACAAAILALLCLQREVRWRDAHPERVRARFIDDVAAEAHVVMSEQEADTLIESGELLVEHPHGNHLLTLIDSTLTVRHFQN